VQRCAGGRVAVVGQVVQRDPQMERARLPGGEQVAHDFFVGLDTKRLQQRANIVPAHIFHGYLHQD